MLVYLYLRVCVCICAWMTTIVANCCANHIVDLHVNFHYATLAFASFIHPSIYLLSHSRSSWRCCCCCWGPINVSVAVWQTMKPAAAPFGRCTIVNVVNCNRGDKCILTNLPRTHSPLEVLLVNVGVLLQGLPAWLQRAQTVAAHGGGSSLWMVYCKEPLLRAFAHTVVAKSR